MQHAKLPVIRPNLSKAVIWGSFWTPYVTSPLPGGTEEVRADVLSLTDTLTTLPVCKFLCPLQPAVTETAFDVHSTCVLTLSPWLQPQAVLPTSAISHARTHYAWHVPDKIIAGDVVFLGTDS